MLPAGIGLIATARVDGITDSCMHMGRPRWQQLLLSIIWCSAICVFATSRTMYDSVLINSYFAASLVTSVIIYLRLRPSVLDALWISGITTLTALVDYRALDFSYQWMGLVSLLGCAGLIVFGVRCIWGASAERKLLLPGLLATALFTGSDFLAPTFHTITTTLHPRTLDLYLLFFDGSLGFQPSFVAGELFHRAHWIESFS